MKERILSREVIDNYVKWLQTEEKSPATIEKYSRDTRAFGTYMDMRQVEKENVIVYKQWLLARGYAASSINSMLASLNSFFKFQGWEDCKVKSMRVQKPTYCPDNKELSKEEYTRLVQTARTTQDKRTELILQTIASTGIRVSELSYITVEAVCIGEATVNCKGKTRKIFLIHSLCQQLRSYIQENHITSGAVFITSRGHLVDRTAIWRSMKALCDKASVNPQKVTPHNLRHLFARTFYAMDKDLAKLADILGHSSINTTRIYIISTGDEHRQCMERLELTL